MSVKFDFRCGQLDLARQKESVEFIRQFIDFLSANGYNALFLYLEDRIRTASYPYPKPEESYSPSEIRQLVSYGESKGIELFPCVGTFGHAERFLAHPELSHLAELQDGRRGRFGGTAKTSFCPTNPNVLAFLEKYISEVASLFPSTYFHAGLDEVWDYVLCDRCRATAPDYQGESQLFLEYIRKIHDIITRQGKQMVMWTDMLEFYPEILAQLPRDIIMSDWQYQQDVHFLRDHFNSATATSLAKYDALGFQVWICPADRFYSNGVTALDYASRFPCVKGALLTSWEKTDTYLYRTLPIFAALGHVMNGEQPDVAFDAAVMRIFPKADAVFLAAMRQTADIIFPRHFESSNTDAIFTREYSSLPFTQLNGRQLCYTIFNRMQEQVPEHTLASYILSDLLESTLECVRSLQMNICAVNMIEQGVSVQHLNDFKQMAKDYMDIYRIREKRWEIVRAGVPNFFTAKLDSIQQRLDDYTKQLKNGRFLRLRVTHSDWYGINGIRAYAKIKGSWIRFWEGVPKPVELDHTQVLDVFVPLPEKKLLAAEALRLEYFGYGGTGIAYACLLDNGKVLRTPTAITSVTGTVEHPEWLLMDDAKFAFLGSQDMRQTYIHKELYDTGTAVEIALT